MINKLIGKIIAGGYIRNDSKKIGIFCGVFGIVSNLSLAILKLFLGIFINSISVMVDAMNNISDLGASIITILGFYIANKPADKEHPFGHGRAEYISAMALSMMIIFVGIQFLKTSWERIMYPEAVIYSKITIVLLLASVFVKIIQFKLYKISGKETNSKTLVAASLDAKSDILITMLIILSLFIDNFTKLPLDAYIGFLVSVLIIFNGWKITKEVIDSLLGSAPDDEFSDKILMEITSVEGIMGCHDLIVHNYGEGRIIATAHAEVSDKLGLVEAHDIIDNAERKVAERLKINLLLHLDPIDFDNPIIKEIFDDIKTKLKEINDEINIHDFRFVNLNEEIVFDMVVPLEFDEDKIFMIKKYMKDYVFAKYNIAVKKINIDRGNTII